MAGPLYFSLLTVLRPFRNATVKTSIGLLTTDASEDAMAFLLGPIGHWELSYNASVLVAVAPRKLAEPT